MPSRRPDLHQAAMVETPTFNKSAAARAIGRVQRLGQRRIGGPDQPQQQRVAGPAQVGWQSLGAFCRQGEDEAGEHVAHPIVVWGHCPCDAWAPADGT